MATNDVDIDQNDHFDASKIILGFTGSIGSGCTFVSEGLQSVLYGRYKYFRLSAMIETELDEDGIKNPTIEQKQDKGNALRKEYGGWILASLLIDFLQKNPEMDGLKGVIVDGIKNTKEVQFLRQFPFFFLFSVQADTEIRCDRSVGKCFNDSTSFYKADKRDEFEEDVDGQQVKECNYLSDMIILNNSNIPKADENAKKDFLYPIQISWQLQQKKMRKGKKIEKGSFFPGQIERIML